MSEPLYLYDPKFFDYIEAGSRLSARTVVGILAAKLRAKTVLDVGCGRGAWLAEWLREGRDVVGIDGEYVAAESLLIPREKFLARDLRLPFDLGQRFCLVQCSSTTLSVTAMWCSSPVRSRDKGAKTT